MDTDALLQPVINAPNQVTALTELVNANTNAFQEIRVDLNDCDNADKVAAIIAKVELALQDLSTTSQKVPPWVLEPDTSIAPAMKEHYGQYPVYQPLNPDNPVPLPPDYVPPASRDAPTAAALAAQPKPGHESDSRPTPEKEGKKPPGDQPPPPGSPAAKDQQPHGGPSPVDEEPAPKDSEHGHSKGGKK